MDIGSLIDAMLAQSQVLTVPWGIDYFSIVVGAVTGALFACERKLDIIGTVVLGLITAYGGGLIRDVILQDQGIYFTSHPDLIVICILICVFVFYFRGLFRRLDRAVFLADTLSVALFALAGASKAFSAGEGVVVSIILGGITAVGGGAVRDICVGETPSIFKQSNFYAVAGLGGATAYVALAWAGCPLPVAGVLCVAVVVGLRYASVVLGLKTKQEADLTPKIMERVRGIAHRTDARDGAALNDVANDAVARDGAARSGTADDATEGNDATCDGAPGGYGETAQNGAAPTAMAGNDATCDGAPGGYGETAQNGAAPTAMAHNEADQTRVGGQRPPHEAEWTEKTRTDKE